MSLPVFILADFNAEILARYLIADDSKPNCPVTIGPWGQTRYSLIDPPADLNYEAILVLWTLLDTVSPAMAQASGFENVEHERILEEVAIFADSVVAFAEIQRAILIPTWTPSPEYRGYGILDWRPGLGLAEVTARANLLLAEKVADCPNVYLLESQRWLSAGGRRAVPPKMWFSAKVPFGLSVFEAAATDIKSALASLAGQSRRLIIVDLDDTLWGGVVGEVGWESLVLGGPHMEGEAFQAFQQRLKALLRRGIQLAIVSKNTESVALEAIDQHPEMALRREDFAAWRINWEDKAANVLEIMEEINLGPQSVVFIDNSPAERARVLETIPEILVPDWPSDPAEYAMTLDSLACFDQPAITTEDRARAGYYQAERERRINQTRASSIEEWLAEAGITVNIQPLADANRSRAAQLFNKTNQMNMATRRQSEQELSIWTAKSGHYIWTAYVIDRFGDYGLTGIITLAVSGECIEIVDFLLSCRVMGRYVEEALVNVAVEKARSLGAEEVHACFVPTARNAPMLSFWERSGFRQQETHHFVWRCDHPFPCPPEITIVGEGATEKP